LLDRWLRAAAAAEVEAARAAVVALPAAPGLAERAKALGDASSDAGCAAAEAERARLFAAESLLGDAGKGHGGSAARAGALPPVAAAPPLTAPANAPSPAPQGAAQTVPGNAAPAAATAQRAPAKASSRPQVRDQSEQKRAIEQTIEAWNRALNARDWAALPALQKLHPGQLERYQAELAKSDVRQKVAVQFIAGFDTGRIDAQVVVTREERTLFIWHTVAKETRKALILRDGNGWKIDGL
jgi:hypothetical protein